MKLFDSQYLSLFTFPGFGVSTRTVSQTNNHYLTVPFPVLFGAVSFQAPMESHNNCCDYLGTYNMLSNNHILFDICMVCFVALSYQRQLHGHHNNGRERWRVWHNLIFYPESGWTFLLLTFHWPKQVMWPRLIYRGWGSSIFICLEGKETRYWGTVGIPATLRIGVKLRPAEAIRCSACGQEEEMRSRTMGMTPPLIWTGAWTAQSL